MLDKLIDMLIDEKMGCEKYKKMAEEQENEEMKKMFMFIAEQEHDHYKMLKEYLIRMMPEQD